MRKTFFDKLNEQIETAKFSESLVCIEMDANAKLGSKVINGDPASEMSANGKLLHELIIRHDLVVVNASDLCAGIITRVNITTIRSEKSILDYFIVCQSFFSLITSMTIDEDRIHVLTKYSSRNGIKKIVQSDHHMLILETKVKYKPKCINERIEIFNFKSLEGQKKYKEVLNQGNTLTSCFQTSEKFEL